MVGLQKEIIPHNSFISYRPALQHIVAGRVPFEKTSKTFGIHITY